LIQKQTLKQIIMKTTTNTNTLDLGTELKELSKRELLIIKAAIALFGMVLNICCLQLIF